MHACPHETNLQCAGGVPSGVIWRGVEPARHVARFRRADRAVEVLVAAFVLRGVGGPALTEVALRA